MKNIFKIRNLSLFLYFPILFISLFGLIFIGEINITILGLDFCYNKVNAVMLLAINLILLLENFILKNNYRINQKSFQCFLVFIILLVNSIILSDNLIIILLLLFFFFLILYFSDKSKFRFSFDLLLLFIVFSLLSWGLIRYFILNDVALTFNNIENYSDVISNFDLNLAFIGFLLLVSRLCNFIPFNFASYNLNLSSIQNITCLTLASNLIVKIYPIFINSMREFQKYIILYLLINVLYYVLVQFENENIIQFLRHTLSANIAIIIFNLFLYSKFAIVSFLYCSIIMIISYGAGFLLADILKSKIGSYKYCDFKKIDNKNIMIKFFILIVFLNLAKLPPFSGFFAFIITTLNLFLIDFYGKITLFIPYCLLLGCFLLSLNTLNVIGKIIVEPLNHLKSFSMRAKQIIIMIIMSVLIFIMGACVQYMLKYFFKMF